MQQLNSNIARLNRICGILDTVETCSSSSSKPSTSCMFTPQPSKVCIQASSNTAAINPNPLITLSPLPPSSAFRKHLQTMQSLFQRQISDLQDDLKRCLSQLRRYQNLLSNAQLQNEALNKEFEQYKLEEATRMSEFRNSVEREFMQSLSEIVMRKDRELEELKNNADHNVKDIYQENLALKHTIVQLKAELVGLERAVDEKCNVEEMLLGDGGRCCAGKRR